MAAVDLKAEMAAAGEDDLNTAWAEKAWLQTVADIEKITGWRLDKEKTPAVETVIKRIKPDDVSDSTKEKAKHVFSQSLTVLQRVGAIVAPAAGMVFGPSQQCFNAVNFVVIAVQEYQSVYEQITALMERIAVFLERFEIRLKQNAEVTRTPGGSKSDLPLMAPTFRVLEHFVTILGRVQKLTHGWKKKLKLFAKIGAFGEDGSIREALGRLETLVQDVTRTEIAVIGRDLSGMAKDMRDFKRWTDQVLDYAQRSDATLGQLKTAKDREDERREMEKVRRKLGLDEKEPWKRHFEKLSEERVKDTGRWILERPDFRRWADFNEARSGVLALRGDSNMGKSFLCSTIIDHMFGVYPPKKIPPRASVGYYFIRRDANERKDSLNDALRAMIWQMVQSDSGYAKLVQRECDRETDFARTVDLWTTLVTNLARTTAATFFLLIDGIEELSEDASNWIADNLGVGLLDSETSGGLRLRILLCGQSKAIDSLQEKCEHRIDTIDLGPREFTEPGMPHVGDLEKYILQRHEWKDILTSMQTSTGDDGLTKDFPARLAASVEGSYSILKDKLRQLEGCKDIEELESIVQVSAKDSREETTDRMKAFAATLNANEVDELNEILTWISRSGDSIYDGGIRVELLTEALSWRFRRQFLLERAVTNRYSNILAIIDSSENRLVWFASELVRSYFENVENEREQLERNVAHQAEMRLVQQVIKIHLKNVFGNDDIYDRTELEDFFRRKQHDVAQRIYLNDAECHNRILEGCLAALCAREATLPNIRRYARTWFDKHVLNSDPMLVGPDARKDISLRLLRLFRDPILIERWWIDDDDDDAFLRYWIEDSDTCDKVVRWLSSTEVGKHIRETQASEENEWVNRASNNPRRALLERIAGVFLNRWKKQLGKSSAMQFLRAYSRLCLGKDVSSINYQEPFSIPDFEDFERWASPEQDTADWQLCMANCLLEFDFAAEASERCQRGLELDTENLKLSFVHGKALAANDKYNTAIEKFENVTKNGENLLAEGDEEYQSVYWSDVLTELGRCQAHLERFEDASETFRKIFKHALEEDTFFESARDSVSYLVATLSSRDKYAEIIQLLQQLSQKKSKNGRTWLQKLLTDVDSNTLGTKFAKDKLGFHSTILCAVRTLRSLAVVEPYYTSVKELLADEKASLSSNDETRFAQGGRLLVKYSYYKLICFASVDDRRKEALNGWEADLIGAELDGVFYDDEDCMYFLRHSAEHIARILLSEATKPVSDRVVEKNPEIRLKNLTKIDRNISRYAPFCDLRLTLGRLYFVTDRKQTARHTLLGIMRSSLNTILEDEASIDEIGMCFLAIGRILAILEDDTNARLAYIFTAERLAATIKLEKMNAEQQDRGAASKSESGLAKTISGDSTTAAAGKQEGKFEAQEAWERALESHQSEHLNGTLKDAGGHVHGADGGATPRAGSIASTRTLEVVIPDGELPATAADGVFITASTPGSGAPAHYRVHQDYLSTDTLRHYHVDYEIDQRDVNYIVINQSLTALEKELMYEHTLQLRRPKLDPWNYETPSEKQKLSGLIQRLRNEALFGNVGLACSNCRKIPSEAKMEWWICRDCLDTMLDADCYLHRRPEICLPDHSHLRLTLRDVQDVRSVNGEREQHIVKWVKQMHQDWGFDRPGLRTFDDILTVTLGIMAAKRLWKERKYGRNRAQYSATPPVPLENLLTREDIVGFKGSGDPAYLAEVNGASSTDGIESGNSVA